ncbi:serine/threonine protein kinase, CMGC, CDC2/CDK subfamily [Saxophila tyrrhenica]|uniref:Serine/threonine protein kinase, CMGC, CDC2/CDK subfamily n=1 Tax=Saxophila tyrrhenica TaxID=1690608 RepID=A0AAV9P177_9PEZI|nr:serine/threonine protein kinase, CMGC, CDC2/CDK subfamily [Saxophila tyrrhenica]
MGSVTTPTAPTTGEGISTDPTQRRFRGAAKFTEYDQFPEKLGEGTFGIVSKARSKRTGNIVALKKILMHNEKEGFPITALREVKLLKMLSHPNVLHLEEMAVERLQSDGKSTGGKKRATLYMVMPYMDHDLSGMLTNPDIRFSEAQVKCYMLQLLEGLRYLHDSHILHRDMKAANLLISNRGLLQIADFGLARHYEGQTPQAGRGNGDAVRDYTSLVVTRWYRPPELLLTLRRYTPAIDMWGVGCVFGEMFERKPILEGKSDTDQCHRIFQLVGSPNDSTMPGWSELPGCEGTKDFPFQQGDIEKRFGPRVGPKGIDLLKQLLCLDWRKRINAIDALQHEYFTTAPLPSRPEDLPKYEDSHELDSRRRGHEKQRAQIPPAPAGGTVGMGPDEWGGSGPVGNYGYGGERPPRRDRGPPPRSYDDRSRGPPPASDARQPAWRQDQQRGRGGGPPVPGPNAANLPPRPDVPARPVQPPGGRDRGGAGGVDTYIPSYSSANPSDRDRPPGQSYDRSRRGSRDGPSYRDPDAPPPLSQNGRERGAYRDPDAPRPPPRDREWDGYRDRDRGGGYGDQRRTRSRSPGRYRDADRRHGGGERERDRDRVERLQNRERDHYDRR